MTAPIAEELKNRIRDLTPEQVQPVDNRVWLETIPPADLTAAGLTIPACAQKAANYAIVRAVGKKISDDALKVNDIVMVDAYQGNEVEFGSRRFLLVDTDQIKARLAV
jgi:co-chaperonin GroES (HSP10)